MTTNLQVVQGLHERNRIYIGLSEISGVYTRLVEALRKQGYPISFSQVIDHPFSYKSAITLSDYRYEKWLQISRKDRHFYFKLLSHMVLRIHHMLWAIRNFDCFFFVNGISFLPKNLDLYLLRLFKKRIISIVSHGSEARPAFMDGAHWHIALKTRDPIAYIYKTARRQNRHLARLEKHSAEIIASPLTSQFLTKQAISSIYLGNPCVEPTYLSPSDTITTRAANVKIVHAPSDRRAKGSDAIADMIERAKKVNPDLEYIELVNRKNSDVLREFETADLVIDQLYSDTFLAGLGVEAGSYGVSVLVGNYGVDVLKSLYPELLPPCFVVHPDHLESKLGELLQDLVALRKAGAKLQQYLKSRQSTDAVAARFLDIAHSRVPKFWYFSPNSVSYVHGSGLAETELIEICKMGLGRFGYGFFNLNQRRDLLDKIMKLLKNEGGEQ